MSDETNRANPSEQAEMSADGSGAGAAMEGELVAADWTPEQVEQWKEQAGKAQDNWDRLLRVSADFDNFKKRSVRERQEAVKYANESLLEKVIPVLDNLEMALAAASNPQGDGGDGLRSGVQIIYNQLKSTLVDAGLEEIDAQGKPFDPNWHEAVSQQPSKDVPEGYVLQQIRKGFKLRDRLIRPATVVVAKKPGA